MRSHHPPPNQPSIQACDGETTRLEIVSHAQAASTKPTQSPHTAEGRPGIKCIQPGMECEPWTCLLSPALATQSPASQAPDHIHNNSRFRRCRSERWLHDPKGNKELPLGLVICCWTTRVQGGPSRYLTLLVSRLGLPFRVSIPEHDDRANPWGVRGLGL